MGWKQIVTTVRQAASVKTLYLSLRSHLHHVCGSCNCSKCKSFKQFEPHCACLWDSSRQKCFIFCIWSPIGSSTSRVIWVSGGPKPGYISTLMINLVPTVKSVFSVLQLPMPPFTYCQWNVPPPSELHCFEIMWPGSLKLCSFQSQCEEFSLFLALMLYLYCEMKMDMWKTLEYIHL